MAPSLVERIFPKIAELAINPRPVGCTKLVGEDQLWRIRIGDYRVIYSIEDAQQTVDVMVIRHRSKAYE